MKNLRSTISLRLRLITIGLTIALFIWFPVEDESETILILFAISFCTLFAVTLLKSSKNQLRTSLRTYILVGILAGAAVSPTALLFMALKTGLHAHPVPDYSKFQIMSVIKQTPIWIISGLLVSIGFGILEKTLAIYQEEYRAS